MRTLLLLALTGCTSIFGPAITQWGNHPMSEIPAEYATWYTEVEACWGKSGDFASIDWWIADKIEYGDVWAGGMTRGDRITMTLPNVDRELYVKHEMSHHISGQGDGIHWMDEYGRHRARCDA